MVSSNILNASLGVRVFDLPWGGFCTWACVKMELSLPPPSPRLIRTPSSLPADEGVRGEELVLTGSANSLHSKSGLGLEQSLKDCRVRKEKSQECVCERDNGEIKDKFGKLQERSHLSMFQEHYLPPPPAFFHTSAPMDRPSEAYTVTCFEK